ncbi:hypothetical protein QQF64_019053, partial [Cirrhinus molitorella]
ESKEFKMLLLGTGESGKTTFMKQMKIIHGSGFSEDERRGYTKLVFQNIFQAICAMTQAMNTLKIPYSNPQNEIYAQWFKDMDIHQMTQLQRSFVDAIRHLWADKGFKMCYSRRREYQLLDSTKYFIDNLDRIAGEDYIPSHQDVLQVRFPTTGITDHCFTLEKMTLRFVDVGGQRGLRRKWIHYFENVMALIFLASLSEYDQLLENNKENRMKESLTLFYNIIHSPWFANSSIILFLNKMDILTEKIQFSDLKTYFPEFEGKRQDREDALEFIRQLYKQKATSNETKNYRMIYFYFTCATDTKNIQRVLHDVKYTVLVLQIKVSVSLFSFGEMGQYYYCACFICCLSEEERNAVAINNEIKHILAEQKKRQRKEIKVLLLGTGESGKTTFMKQMKIIHENGFSEDERRGYTKLVFQNIFQAICAMTQAMNTLKIPYSNPQNEIYAQWFKDMEIYQMTQLQRSFVEAIRHLWADKGFKMCYSRRREYQLLDSTKYFIENLDRIAGEDFIPTHQDVLQVRFPTTGITDHCFTLEKMTLRIVDVGGQRGQRKKWIHCFENVMSLIFLASLSEYDLLLEENNKDNRMEESLSLFYMTIHSKWFANSSIILFLNKKDILAEKIQFSDLKTYFPAFHGKRRDAVDAMEFIRTLYKQKAVSYETKNSKSIYSHFTCATDTKNIHKVFNDVKDTVLVKALEDFGIV